MSAYLLTIIKVLLLCNILNAQTTPTIDCSKCADGDFTSRNHRPQDCAQCNFAATNKNKNDLSIDAQDAIYLRQQMKNISTMITVLLILVILMMILLLYFIIRNSNLSNAILKSWKSCWKSKDGKDSQRKEKELNHVIVHKEPQRQLSAVKSEKQKVLFLNDERTRHPSESLSPDDSEAVVVDGYDNLGMSRSTINTHSRCSSPSSPTSNTGVASCATIETTMTTINLDS